MDLEAKECVWAQVSGQIKRSSRSSSAGAQGVERDSTVLDGRSEGWHKGTRRHCDTVGHGTEDPSWRDVCAPQATAYSGHEKQLDGPSTSLSSTRAPRSPLLVRHCLAMTSRDRGLLIAVLAAGQHPSPEQLESSPINWRPFN